MGKDTVTIRFGGRARDMGTLADLGPPVELDRDFRRIDDPIGGGGLRIGSGSVPRGCAEVRAISPKQALPRTTVLGNSSTEAGSPEAHQRNGFQFAGLSDEAWVSSPETWRLP
jgi:hypothetical protein